MKSDGTSIHPAGPVPQGPSRARGDRPHKKDAGAGFSRLLYDLWHRRQRFRQFVGVALVLWFTAVGRPTPVLWWSGGLVLCLGMAVRLWASGYVMKNEVLATIGPYGFVRHPLYVGNLLIALGICIASGLWWSYPVMLAMVLYFYPHTIRYEDRKLHRNFGQEWERWAAETRALVPRLTPYRSPGQEQQVWSLRLSLMRNAEPVHIAVGVLCLAYLATRM